MKKNSLTVKDILAVVKQLKNCRSYAKNGKISLPLRGDIRVTASGSIQIPGIGYMHPNTFADIAGQEALDYLLTLPRVICEYDYEDVK